MKISLLKMVEKYRFFILERKIEVLYLSPKQVQTVFLVIVIFAILTTAGVLLYRFPDKYEIIFATIGAIFGACSLYVSAISYEVARDAKEDSGRSADATVESTEIARKAREDSKISSEVAVEALQLARADQIHAWERFRSERGPLLNMHKQEMLIPLVAPFIPQGATIINDRESRWDYSSIILSNDGAGAATSIDLSWDFINAEEYGDFGFYTSEIQRTHYTLAQFASDGKLYPEYGLKLKYIDERFHIQGELGNAVRDGRKRGRIHSRSRTKKSMDPMRVGTLKNQQVFFFDLPWHYRVLVQQFFLERVMVPSVDSQLNDGIAEEAEGWKTPNPRLRIRIDYVDTVLDHMNDFKEAARVKEFEITCSENISLVRAPKEDRPEDRTDYAIRCYLNIQTIYDRPLSEIQAEETSIEEEETNGSTGPTEG
ncbi:hypothetical protein [Exiguobacterium acetylicum]|uniref:hypothetical protein n=1 Tax=Exiguobacterium acetylicum TaxID=41170 RepID=UPI000681D273|nr:hypothetical protein [Exiguobacterium acetylicum]KNH32459.1 hypothetical protein ACS74_14255 [Exiguobacterium acetylicum]